MNYQQQQQGYPQPGYGGYGQQPGFVYPQQQTGYPAYPSGQRDPTVSLNIGPQSGYGGPGAAAPGWGADPSGIFQEKAIRQAFVSKVFSILTLQLIATSILIAAFVLSGDTKLYFARSQGWMFLGFGIFIVTYLVLVCVESARRSTPMNFILLSMCTAGYGLVAAVISCRYDTITVMSAFLATGVSCGLLALFARTTSFDMTECGCTLLLLGLAHALIGIILILIFGRAASIFISIAGALLASLYLVFDLQLIMGGRKCELSPEEYILAAIMLYTDIVQIFIYMLEIFSRLSDD